jgi:hypothetical protein
MEINGIFLYIADCLQQIVTRSGDRITDMALWERILTCSYVGSFDGSGFSDIASAGAGLTSDRAATSGTENASKDFWFKVWTDSLINSGIGTKQQALKKCVNVYLYSFYFYIIIFSQ